HRRVVSGVFEIDPTQFNGLLIGQHSGTFRGQMLYTPWAPCYLLPHHRRSDAPDGWARILRPATIFVSKSSAGSYKIQAASLHQREEPGYFRGAACSNCVKSNYWASNPSARRRKSSSAAAASHASSVPTAVANPMSSTPSPGFSASKATKCCAPSACPTASSTAQSSARPWASPKCLSR